MSDFIDRLGSELTRVADTPTAALSQAQTGRPVRASRRVQRLRVLLIAAAMVLGMTGVALAASEILSRDAAPPEAGRKPTTQTKGSLLEAFGILRRPATAADLVPKPDRVTFSGASGANILLARRARGLTAGAGWVVPGRSEVCIIAASATNKEQGGAGCTGDAAAMAGKLRLQGATANAAGTEFVAGLVPDGVTSVTLRLTDGKTMRVPVYENMYELELRGRVAAVVTDPPDAARGSGKTDRLGPS